ncbi:hypothetical protein SMALA_5281 [Streptomyces malaysiensis subsp. malaysiensis]|nr:hypothetical protein SMALA_5281 [Streptomyces malaysiensis]
MFSSSSCSTLVTWARSNLCSSARSMDSPESRNCTILPTSWPDRVDNLTRNRIMVESTQSAHHPMHTSPECRHTRPNNNKRKRQRQRVESSENRNRTDLRSHCKVAVCHARRHEGSEYGGFTRCLGYGHGNGSTRTDDRSCSPRREQTPGIIGCPQH